MDFIELAESRRSVRSFKPGDISEDFITKLLEAASFAPSGGNRQPWHFFVIRNKTLINEIQQKSCNQSFISTAPVLFVVCADILRSEERYAERGRNLYSLQDTAAAIQNILLCAKSLGLGTCWCGAFNEEAIAELLNLKKDMRPVAIIPIGYPENEPAMPKRRPIEEIATFIM